MKNFVHKICFGKESKITVLLVLFVFAFVGFGCSTIKKALDDAQNNSKNDNKSGKSGSVKDTKSSQGGPSNAPATTNKTFSSKSDLSDDEVAELAQDTIQQFADAVETEDFTEFRENVSTPFKQQFSAAAVKGAFNAFINVKKQVVPILRSTGDMTPTFSPEPAVSNKGSNKFLDVNGKYDTSPLPTNFVLQYVDDGGEWKLLQINIQVKN